MAHKVLLNVPVPEELRKMLDEHCEVTIMSEGSPSPDHYASFDGLFGYSLFPIDEALMNRLSSLKVISIHGVGVERCVGEVGGEGRGAACGTRPVFFGFCCSESF